jgi:glycosyltransferase involved in cell wall biosynthesis
MPDLSLIVPVFNEKNNLGPLYDAVVQAVQPLKLKWELVFVDDGSQDGSLEVLKELAKKDRRHVSVIVFRRNFGQTAAIAAGLDHSSGDVIVLLDADMQNDPADIPMMLAKLDEGYDVVSGWRKNRKDNAITRNLPSFFANRMISIVTGVHLHDYGCTLKAYRREVLGGFRLYGEMHRFIPVFAHSVGAKIAEVVVQHHPRKYGKTKYGLERTVKVVLDLFTVRFLLSYSHKPIYLFGGTGIGMMIISAATLIFLMIRRLAFNISPFDSPFFQMSGMFFILGFQSILMGLIAEMLVRTYHEAQNKKTYTIRDIIRFGKSKA